MFPYSLYDRLKKALFHAGFEGDVSTRSSDLVVGSRDNSIYSVTPHCMVFPKHKHDVQRLMTLLQRPDYRSLTVTARGGFTGTNGQSLNTGIIVDFSRYMTRLLELNIDKGWVTVEPGMVLDQLNALLSSDGLFFSPHVAPGNRATIGGMISTDASGKGSRVYGKTSDHVLELEVILSDGSLMTISQNVDTRFSTLLSECSLEKELVQQIFPKHSRFMSGYNVAHFIEKKSLIPLLCGSEGTLALVVEAKLNIIPKPKVSSLLVLAFPSLEDGCTVLPEFSPYFLKQSTHFSETSSPGITAIECMDNTLFELARSDDRSLSRLRSMLGSSYSDLFALESASLFFVEIQGYDTSMVETYTQQIYNAVCLSISKSWMISDPQAISLIWGLRKNGVGLLSKKKGAPSPIPFVEDAAVPIEHLASFISGFKSILDAHNLSYGMYGHADVGVVHVRPALDLNSDHDRALISTITHEVFALVSQYKGIFWGEHGKGFRSELTPQVVGKTIYGLFEKIKGAFDPDNRLNPGKIVSPPGISTPLYSIQASFKSDHASISESDARLFSGPLSCNGNGVCHSVTPSDLLCPSYRLSFNKAWSPKGRSLLIESYLQDPHTKEKETDVVSSLNYCLGCQACSSLCPANVTIPLSKSLLFSRIFQSKWRPISHYIEGYAEHIAPYLLFFKRLTKKTVQSLGGQLYDPHKTYDPATTVFIMQDIVTGFLEPEIGKHTLSLISKMGLTPVILPYTPTGKGLFSVGLLREFDRLIEKNKGFWSTVISSKVPVVCLEPSFGLFLREELKKYAPEASVPVHLIQDWLVENKSRLHALSTTTVSAATLLPHCHEQSYLSDYTESWATLFMHLGVAITFPKVGCCGMAGFFGYKYKALAEQLFRLSWQKPVTMAESPLLVTGGSCRHITKKLGCIRGVHPVVFLDMLFCF